MFLLQLCGRPAEEVATPGTLLPLLQRLDAANELQVCVLRACAAVEVEPHALLAHTADPQELACQVPRRVAALPPPCPRRPAD